MPETITTGTIATPERGWPIQQEIREMIKVIVTDKNTEIKSCGDERVLTMDQSEALQIIAVARAIEKLSKETRQNMKLALEQFCNREYKLDTGRVFRPRQVEKDNQLIYRNI